MRVCFHNINHIKEITDVFYNIIVHDVLKILVYVDTIDVSKSWIIFEFEVREVDILLLSLRVDWPENCLSKLYINNSQLVHTLKYDLWRLCYDSFSNEK